MQTALMLVSRVPGFWTAKATLLDSRYRSLPEFLYKLHAIEKERTNCPLEYGFSEAGGRD